MKFFVAALVLMMMLPACSADDDSVVVAGDVTVEDTQIDTTEDTDVVANTVD